MSVLLDDYIAAATAVADLRETYRTVTRPAAVALLGAAETALNAEYWAGIITEPTRAAYIAAANALATCDADHKTAMAAAINALGEAQTAQMAAGLPL